MLVLKFERVGERERRKRVLGFREKEKVHLDLKGAGGRRGAWGGGEGGRD